MYQDSRYRAGLATFKWYQYMSIYTTMQFCYTLITHISYSIFVYFDRRYILNQFLCYYISNMKQTVTLQLLCIYIYDIFCFSICGICCTEEIRNVRMIVYIVHVNIGENAKFLNHCIMFGTSNLQF